MIYTDVGKNERETEKRAEKIRIACKVQAEEKVKCVVIDYMLNCFFSLCAIATRKWTKFVFFLQASNYFAPL